MFHQQKILSSGAILFAFTATSISAVSLIILPAFAQSSGVSTSFPVPQSVPSGTAVQINGTTSMEKINQALAERFEAKFPGTDVKTAYDGTDAALKALPNGKIDLAAIGRSLTEEEKARGLVSTPVTRNKIAVILGRDNPYKNSLTSEQFARIFRGEITNWSQVGGSPQAIRLIDRPENSDLRRSFQNYPVFKTAAFKTGANTVKSEDSTEAVINKLGTDGIGYAIADQVINNPNVQIVPLHNVLPTDPRYPFSQPLGYAHQRPITNPTAQAFLGYATAPENQQIVEEARVANAIATPAAVSIPTTTATRSRDEFPWWILLLLPLLGGLLWWLLSRRTHTTNSAPAPVAAPVPLPVRRTPESRIILTPRNCRDAYAYWEVPDEVRQDLQRLGGRNLKVRLYDVTDIDMDRQTPHSMKEFDCDEQAQDIHIPIALDNRDYIAELGYMTNSDRWVEIARSSHVRVPACEPVGTIPLATAGVTTGVAANSLVSDRPRITKDESRLILVPRDSRDVYAYWEVPEAQKAELQRQGGRKLALRVYNTTGIDQQRLPARNFRQFDCDESTPDLHIPIAEGDRDYVAELGYVTDDGRWLELTRSTPTKVSSTFSVDNAARPSSNTGTVFERSDNVSNVANKANAAIAGSTAVAGMAAARSLGDREQPYPDENVSRHATARLHTTDAVMKSDCRIILVPRNFQDAYAYWEISDEYKAYVRRQGGRRFMLRIHDVTNLDINNQLPHSTQEYVCDEHDQDKHVAIPMSDRDYIAEVGYYTDDNRWLSIIRSFHVHVPSDGVIRNS
ncbi:DUF4912 domain-containing protein [Komarekiella sp. 'clone 1']|uniref:DUF4912 domain-containing protein n=2 Tax=Komarekiella TaxID=2022127 RepID=A0AA40T4B3_9NOST|nr:DUF4912 domain-containing protein [Komarekiella delphini-convector SJRDD-AB1]